MASNRFDATYYDGRTSGRWPVEIELHNNFIQVSGKGITRHEAYQDVHIEPQVGHLRGQIRFADGAMCEVADGKALMAAVPASHQPKTLSFIHRLENKLHYIVATVVLAIAVVWGLIDYGVPIMARSVAQAIPIATEKTMGEQVMAGMDRVIFSDSELSKHRQEELLEKFHHFIQNNHGNYHYKILFRKSEKIGANAFALPSGIIVFTDDMVKLAEDDRELLAVLAHEIGHVEQRHAVRHILQDSITVVLLVMVTGDIESATSLVAALPTALVQAKFSREFEAEADTYAAKVLQQQQLSPHWLGTILTRLDEKDDKGKSVPGFMTTHPSTPERVEQLKQLQQGNPL